MYSLGIPSILLAVLLIADDKKPDPKDQKDPKSPAAKLTLGKDTTYVMGPLDKQGYVDYESALNAELSRGVTADTNANVLLWKAFGPTPEGGSGMPTAYFKWLDTTEPPKDGEYFVGIDTFARDRLALTQNQLTAVYDQQSWATKQPWSAKEYTVVAEWLKFNEKPLAVVVEATKRPDYFNPLCSRRNDDNPGSLIGALLPSVQKCRELATALTARAMLRVEEGKFKEAWDDLIACHRLARLTTRGATLIESLVGIAIGAIASNSTLAYLERANLDSKQALAHLKDLQALPAFRPMDEKINTGERFMGLDSLQLIRRGGGMNVLGGDIFGEKQKPTEEDRKALAMLDWDAALRNVNKWYDRMAEAMRVKDRAEREKAFDKLEADLASRRKAVAEPGKFGELVKNAKDPKAVGTEVALSISDVLMGLLAPAIRKVQSAHDRAEQIDRNLYVAFALAAYKADNGKYPAKLDDLAPKYLARVPGDAFSGKPLIYKPSDKGYLFYSVGQNGQDEEGRWYDDEPRGDDPRVKMPLPPLKKNE